MNYKWRINALLSIIIVSILTLNILLHWLDPLGLVAYRWQLSQIFQLTLPHDTGYRFTPGRFDIGYRLTIGNDGLRIVLDTNLQAECTIAVLGDSVAFGMGIADSDVLVNMLAQDYPNIHWINAALPGYNSRNIARQASTIQADGYLWLIIQNDGEPDINYRHIINNPPLALSIYIQYLIRGNRMQFSGTFNSFSDGIDNFLSDRNDNLIIFAFKDQYLTDEIITYYPNIIKVPYWTSQISIGDAHPDKQGNREIANSLQPYIEQRIGAFCNGQ